MTDRWCFTCDHEIRETIDGYVHLHPDDEEDGCVCAEDELKCEPR